MILNEKIKLKILSMAFNGDLLNYNGIREQKNGYYLIPSHWGWKKLGEIVHIVNGFTPLRTEKSFWDKEEVNWFTIDDIRKQGQFITKTEQYITKKALGNSVARLLPPNTTLLCCTASVGEVAFSKISLTTNQQFNGLIIKDEYREKIDPYYIFEYSKTLKNILLDKAGKTTINFVSTKKLSEILIPIPPFEEQKKIVEKIEELFTLIDKKEKNDQEKEKLKSILKDKILDSAIHGNLVNRNIESNASNFVIELKHAKDEFIINNKLTKSKESITKNNLFEIPEHWCWTTLGEICFITKLAGFEYTKDVAPNISNVGEIPLVRAQNIKPNCFIDECQEFISMDLSKKLYRCALDTKCVLMTFIGAGIGEVAIFDKERRYHLAPNVAKIVPAIDINKYIMYYLMSKKGKEYVFEYKKSTAQASLSMETIRNVAIPIPPLNELNRIVEKIESLFELIEQL